MDIQNRTRTVRLTHDARAAFLTVLADDLGVAADAARDTARGLGHDIGLDLSENAARLQASADFLTALQVDGGDLLLELHDGTVAQLRKWVSDTDQLVAEGTDQPHDLAARKHAAALLAEVE